ncbi:MAG: hypothetical protein ABIZ04_16145 [Opitutus sp.]
MKKALIICSVFLLLVGAAGITAGYFFVYKPAKQYVASFQQLQILPKLETELRNQTSYSAPASGELTPSQMQRFLDAQHAVQTQLGQRVDQIGAKYRWLQKSGESKEQPPLSELVGALKEMAGLIVDGKRAQVNALNQQQFSLGEYEWIRARVYEASGIPLDLNFQAAIREAAAGKVPNFDRMGQTSGAPIPDSNRALVAPYKKQLSDFASLAFFGL